MQVKLLTFGDEIAVAANFEHGAERVSTVDLVFARIAADMMRAEEAVFSSQGRRGGGSWKPLKPETLARKGTTQILRDTHALQDSLTHPGAAHQILHFNNEVLEFGTDRPFAYVHQFGSPKRNIPARPFLKFTPTDTTRWGRWIFEHLMGVGE